MTRTMQREFTPAGVEQAVEELAPAINARADETEAARRLPADLLDELVAAGCFRLLVPEAFGGIGATLPEAMRVYEALARADASVGWTVMIGSSTWCDLAGMPKPTVDALFADGPDVIIAGAFNPSGIAVPVDGGYRVSGRWAFASGCEHARWIYGNCIEQAEGSGGDGPPPAGPPPLRIALFSPDEVEIEDTWRVVGMCGTGSHHFRVDNVVVPAERTYRPLADEPWLDDPAVRVPPPSLFALEIAAVAAGAARGALDDIVALAGGKVPLLSPAPLAANPLFQFQLATADTELRAARALLYETAGEAWAAAVQGTPYSWELRGRIRAGAAWVVSRAAAAVDAAYGAGGGSSLYLDSPLQRRLRDVRTLSQHFLMRPDTLSTAGAILAGQEPDVMVF